MSTAARITITSQVLAYLKTANLHDTSEIPVSDVADRMGMEVRKVRGAVHNLRRQGIIPAASDRKPRIERSDWTESSSWAWAIYSAPETKVKTQLEIAVENEKRASAVQGYIREWKRLRRSGVWLTSKRSHSASESNTSVTEPNHCT